MSKFELVLTLRWH